MRRKVYKTHPGVLPGFEPTETARQKIVQLNFSYEYVSFTSCLLLIVVIYVESKAGHSQQFFFFTLGTVICVS
jgi:hypothetical protein